VAVEDLRFSYEPEGFALHVPRLEVARGEHVVLIGPSGSGKTTLLNLVAGILVPGSGRVVVDGREVSALPDAERRRFRIGNVGLIFQEFELLEHLTVRENLLLPYYVHPALALTDEVRDRAETLARALGVERYLRKRPAALSQGERQRVAVGRALVTEPAILLADEPTGNLDPRNKDAILDLVFAQAKEQDATLLMVTHDHSLLPRFDRVVDFAGFLAPGGAP
jgi:ABC-type lipoprotein export system ATPase subunit